VNDRAHELALRQGELRARIALQRTALASHSGGLERVLGAADKALAGVDWLKAHPEVVGVFVQTTTGVTNPSGGSSTSGALMPLGTDGVYLGECLLYSGATMTEAQFLAQYQRGMGSY
jgi:hypothetical protein